METGVSYKCYGGKSERKKPPGKLNRRRENSKGKAVPLHAMEALEGRGGIAPTHSRPRH
jgi:hypothetical protein